MPNITPAPPSAFPFARFRRLRFGRRPRCPHCGVDHVHRWGRSSGRQRYRCTACSRTFNDFTGTPLAHLKHIDRWPAFCRCALDSLTVRRSAALLGVDKMTAFRWRHRLLTALRTSDTAPLGVTVTIHETSFPFSEKGRRDLDRPPRRRSVFGRLDIPVAWVFVAADEAGRPASGVVGPRRPGADDLLAALEARLHRTTELVSVFGPYGATGLLAVRTDRAYRRAGWHSPEFEPVHASVLALRRWLRRFHGVATRYLDNYLAWHRLLELGSDVLRGQFRQALVREHGNGDRPGASSARLSPVGGPAPGHWLLAGRFP